MSKCFRKGFKYVFTKKKYIKSRGRKKYRRSKCWVDEVNGRQVEFEDGNTNIGECNFCLVMAEWCKCIGEEKSVF